MNQCYYLCFLKFTLKGKYENDTINVRKNSGDSLYDTEEVKRKKRAYRGNQAEQIFK